MKTLVNTASVLTLLLLAAGCAVTNMTSFTDPAYRGAKPPKSVMVFAKGMGMGERQVAENMLVEEFSALGVKAFRGIDYIPPTRDRFAGDEAKVIRASGVEAMLVLTITGRDTTTSYVPPTYIPGTTTTQGSIIGNTLYAQTYTTPGYTVGGYSIYKPHAGYTATLIDVAKSRIIWQAEGQSRGNAFATFEDLTISASQKVVRQLKEDGVFSELKKDRPQARDFPPSEPRQQRGNPMYEFDYWK